MKKNILRVLSLTLVAVMLFAFTACSQEVLVRFVDSEGQDLDLEKIFGGNSAVNGANSENAVPVDPTQQAPAQDATTAGSAEATTAGSAEATTAGSAEAPTAADTKPVSTVPQGKEAIFNFYKTAANAIRENGVAGYDKIEYQALTNLNLTGISGADNLILRLAGNYMTKEDAAEVQVNEKGTGDATGRFPACKLTDLSKVASADLETLSNGNYKITIIMVDEDTPKKDGSFLGQVTNSLLYWEDIDAELQNISAIKEYSDIHVIYAGYKIEAEMTPAGQFVSLMHLGTVNIKIGHAKVIISFNNKDATLINTAKYYNFKY